MYRRSLLVAVVLSLSALSACGGSSKSSSPPCPAKADSRAAVNGAVTVCALDPVSFDVKTITTPPGALSVTLINKGSQPHTFKVDDTDFELKTPGHNDVKTGTVTLTAGTHTFSCTIPGHAAAGMKGTIVVS